MPPVTTTAVLNHTDSVTNSTLQDPLTDAGFIGHQGFVSIKFMVEILSAVVVKLYPHF